MSDEESLNAALDADPGDLVTRAVLSDLYEEQGRMEEAEGQRWLIAVEKWPTHPDFMGYWDWWVEYMERPKNSIPPNALLSSDLYVKLEAGAFYHTRREAEADLIRAAGILQGVTA